MIALEDIKQISKEKLGPLTVLAGDDVGQYQLMKEAFLQAIGYDPADLNDVYYDMKESSYGTVELDLVSLPFFADQKIVILDHFQDLTTAKKRYLTDDELKSFERYLEEPAESTKLVIFADGNLDSKRRIVKLIKRDGVLFEAKELKEQDLRKYFQAQARELGLQFSAESFEMLLNKSSFDFSELTKNLQFLKSYKEDGVIGVTEIEEAIPKTLQDNLFDLTQFVLKGQVKAARALVRDLVLQGEDEVKLIAIMMSQFRIMTQVQILAQEGMTEQQMGTTLAEYLGRKVNPYQIRFALRDSRPIGLERLKLGLKVLTETDYQIKTGTYDKDYLLDLAILKIATTP